MVIASVKDLLESSGVKEGTVTVLSRHTTTACFLNEAEERLLDDCVAFFEKLAPSYPPSLYKHNDLHLRSGPPDWPGGDEAWREQEPINAHSHLISMVLGNSLAIPVTEGKLVLGTYQSVIFVELDGPRERKIGCQVHGMK